MQMDIDESASIDVNKSTLKSTKAGTEDLSVNEPANDADFLNSQKDREGVPDSRPPYDEYDLHKKDQAIEKCFGNTTSSEGTSMEVDSDAHPIIVQESTPCDNVKSADQPCSSTPALPTALKPVPAMKGSREKRGATPPQKLTVKWSPEVYDPVPTSVSHAVTNKKPKRQSKKNSKSKQKNGNKSSCGNTYKDKLAGRGGGG